MKKLLSIIRDIAFIIFVLFICGMIFIMATGKHVSFRGYQVLRVLTSSMEPAISENTCIIIRECDPDQLKEGDIITFTSDDPQIQGYYNTHRIYQIAQERGETLFITKGDASPYADAYPVHKDQVAGIFVKELPGGRLLGKAFLALSDNRVYFLVIMLPLTLCLLSYLWQIIGFVTGRYEEGEPEEADMLEDDESLEGLEEDAEFESVETMEESETVGDFEGVETLDEADEELKGVEILDDPASDRKPEEVQMNQKNASESEELEKERVQRMVDNLVSGSVEEEEIEKKRRELQKEYKKILGNRKG